MIIKLDHISCACQYSEEQSICAAYTGYKEVFNCTQLKNSIIKFEFMREIQEKHNIRYLTKSHAIPIEIVSYRYIDESISSNPLILLDHCSVQLKTNSIKNTRDFFLALGFKEECGDGLSLALKGPLDPFAFKIKLKKTNDKLVWHLDQKGINNIAVIVSHIENERKRLHNIGVYCSEIDKISINNRMWNVFFARGKQGELVEVMGKA